MLTKSVKNNTQVLIGCNKKLLGRVKALNCSIVLENVKERWTKLPKSRVLRTESKRKEEEKFNMVEGRLKQAEFNTDPLSAALPQLVKNNT